MSLIRQVWLLVLGGVLAAVLGSVAVSSSSMRELLQTQLQLKNSDNAAALALALSQQGGDRDLMQLLISAQFDTGYYRSLRWLDADGHVLFEREGASAPSGAPTWFVALNPLHVEPGVAKVSNGWTALGSIEVRSHSGYAHDELWRATRRSALWLGGVGLLAGLVAALALGRMRRPLDALVAQAQALTQGGFRTVADSRVPELARLSQAMNTMVERVRTMFEAQAEQLQVLKQQAHADALTGMSHRKHFLAELESALTRDEGPDEAGLVLLRLRDLAGHNQRLGRAVVDQALVAIAHAVKVYPERVNGCLAGRLNGADFALWLPAPDVAGETARALADALQASLPAFGAGLQVALGAVSLPRQRPVGEWFGAADAALAAAESRPGFVVESVGRAALEETQTQGERAWHQQIEQALAQRETCLMEYPVLDRELRLLHLESPLRLRLQPDGEFLSAQHWLPLAMRSHLTAEVDLHAVAAALEAIAADGQSRSVNIAPASLQQGGFVARLRELVFQSPQAARKLGLELAEPAAIEHFELLQEMGRQLRPLGVRLGLEHAGAGLSQVERLFQAGLDYVKLDRAVVTGVAGDAARAAYVRGLVIMLRSLALKVHAEGVDDVMDAAALWDCGLDGITGPWATRQAPA